MDDYISRKAAIEDLSAEALERNLDSVMTDNAHRYHRAAERVIAGVPAADVRPVVLCRDCIHAQRYTNKIKCGYWSEQTASEIVCEDDFCSYGEKREES